MPQIIRAKSADINVASSGDNSIVLLTASRKVVVWKAWIVANAAVNLKFGNGDATQTPTYFNAFALPLTAQGSAIFFAYDGQPYWETTTGNGFSINLSGAVQITGRIYYTIE